MTERTRLNHLSSCYGNTYTSKELASFILKYAMDQVDALKDRR